MSLLEGKKNGILPESKKQLMASIFFPNLFP
jgi:hypothetical protein